MAAKKKNQLAEAVADAASDQAKIATETSKKLGKLFKRGSLGSKSDVVETIPSSLEVLDKWIMGTGGWPVRRMVEVFSKPSGGKSSLGFAALAGAQRAGGVGILVEAERGLQTARAAVFGVDLSALFLSEPNTIEEVLSDLGHGLDAIPEGAGPNMLVWDSLAMSSLGEVYHKGQDAKKGMAGRPGLIAEQLPPIIARCADKRTCLMVINHAKTKIGMSFGDPTTTPGGDNPKFSASIRLQGWDPGRIKKGDEVVGISATFSAAKNKLGLPNRKAKLRLLFETGWDDVGTTLGLAKERKLLPPRAQGAEAHYAARAVLGFIPMDDRAQDYLNSAKSQKANDDPPETLAGFSLDDDDEDDDDWGAL